MSTLFKIVLSATLITAAALAARPAHASCIIPNFFSSGYSYVYTDGCGGSTCGALNTSVTDDLLGSFWALGDGDPVVGAGIDNGSVAALGGWFYIYPGYPATINFQFLAGIGLDGCVLAAADNRRCLGFALNDINPSSGDGAFALITALPNELGNYDLSQRGNITLVPIPRPVITGSASTTNGGRITVQGPSAATLAAGLYLDSGCSEFLGGSPVEWVRGYRVYLRETEIESAPPVERATADWTALTDVVPLGNPVTVTVECSAGAADQWLAIGLAFESDFESAYVSGPSTRIACGPNLADPGVRTPRPRRSLRRSKIRP